MHIMHVKSMIVKSNFIAEASFSVESKEPKGDTDEKISMKCNEVPNEQSAFEETLMVINAIIAKVLEESKDVFEEVDLNKSNAYNVEEKLQTFSLENIILPTQEETFDVKSMLAESNFIAEASFTVKSKNAKLFLKKI
jgi:hypothetical protein